MSPMAAGVVLAGFWLLMLVSLREKSATYDEMGHATAGYTYWKFDDYRIDPENGNLSQRWIALPRLFGSYPFPSLESKAWLSSDSRLLADEWFNRMGNDVSGMLVRGRAISGLLAVALGALVWLWSRQLFGPCGGMLSLLLYVLNPTILANGALMTSDAASALFFLAATWSLWAMLQKISPGRVLLSAFVMGGLFVSKMSAALILPIAATLVAARLVDGRPLAVAMGTRRELTRRGQQALAFITAGAVHGLVVFLIVWGCYGFRYTAFAPTLSAQAHFSRPWEWALDKPNHGVLLNTLSLSPTQAQQAMAILRANDALGEQWSNGALLALQAIRENILTPAQIRQLDELMSAPPPSPMARLLAFVNEHRLLPEAYVYGHAHVWRLSQRRDAFFNDEISKTGWRSYFPFTFLVKTPLAVFGVMALAVIAALAQRGTTAGHPALPRWRPAASALYATIPLWTLMVFYWAMVIPSHINIGHRHLIPIYPPLFVLCGAAVLALDPWWNSGSRQHPVSTEAKSRLPGVVLCGLMVALAAEVFYRFPNYLAYFNGIVSPASAYRHLIDSSLDWGQDLPGVKRYLEQRHPPEPVYLAYFGTASPRYYGITARQIYSHPGYERADSPPLKILFGSTSGQADAAVTEFLRQQPEYDSRPIGTVQADNTVGTLLLKRPSALRLSAGTYFISASLLQPVFFNQAGGYWNAEHEATYLRLSQTVAPLLEDDVGARAAALRQSTVPEWNNILFNFDEYRFARLTAYLRKREPDDNVNFSILVYKLTDADLTRALHGPAP